MMILGRCVGSIFLVSVGLQLIGCPPTQPSGSNINPPTVSWTIEDLTTGETVKASGNTATNNVPVGSGDNLNIAVSAQSPDGITEMRLSGSGSYVCGQSDSGPPVASGTISIPTQDVHPKPPQTAYLLAAILQMQCAGRAGASSGLLRFWTAAN
jgi:hypothetical protein